MSQVFLKVKVKSLTDEARTIQLEEWRAKARYRRARKHFHEGGIGQEELDRARARNLPTLDALHAHRVTVVRTEARATQLAYAYLRGKDYLTVERDARSQPNWPAVRRMVGRYGTQDQQEKFEAWQKPAAESIEARVKKEPVTA